MLLVHDGQHGLDSLNELVAEPDVIFVDVKRYVHITGKLKQHAINQIV